MNIRRTKQRTSQVEGRASVRKDVGKKQHSALQRMIRHLCDGDSERERESK